LWTAIILSGVALVITAATRIYWTERVSWTSWIIPILVMIVPVSLLLPKRYERAARAVILVGIPIAGAVIAYEVARLLHW
jgi:hypothetical protein